MRQAKGTTNGRSRIAYIVWQYDNVTLWGDIERSDGDFWQGGSPVCWGIYSTVEEGEVAVDSGKERWEVERGRGHYRDLGGVGVREVLVLELRGVILIECLHTLILKIKNWGMVVHRSGGVRAKVMVADGRGWSCKRREVGIFVEVRGENVCIFWVGGLVKTCKRFLLTIMWKEIVLQG